MALVKANEDEIDLVLATGDIAQDASEKAYVYFLEIIASLNSPFRWIPGNHDNATVMNRIAEGYQEVARRLGIIPERGKSSISGPKLVR